jgi:hypothetical protein
MPDFTGVHEAIADKFGEQASDQPKESTTEVEQSSQQESEPQTPQSQERNEQAQALIDLSKAEKFMFEGKEYTLDQLKREMMLQSDYTRKTQAFAEERKQFEQQRELDSHFKADLPKLLRNPELIRELPKHYPKEYVDLAREYLKMSGQPPKAQEGTALARDEIESLIESKFRSHEEKLENQRLVNELDNVFAELKSKYPDMKDGRMERFVLSELQAIDSTGKKIDRAVVESTFKQLSEWIGQSRESYHKEQLKKQSEANKKAKDIGSGGGTPGQSPAKMKLGDVKGALLNHLQNQQN